MLPSTLPFHPRNSYLFMIPFLFLLACGEGQRKKESEEKGHRILEKKDKNGNPYKTVTNDPYGVRIYELDNGLKVYLAKNEKEPRVQTFIAVRAGSAHEQKETTGLAHYLEHMLFKGTDRIGTLNWEEEKPLIDSISTLYEKRRKIEDSSRRKELYERIDSLSQKAAQYAVPNEYDKIVSAMGGQRTNAFTSKDRTVYMNNIPSNQIERWVKLERERFRKMALRLFHTELETVFEEFNQNQDSDYSLASEKMNKALYPGHPYRYSTIGKAEDLKNPSMKNVHAFKEEYYVPNNMAICLSGDLEPAETFAHIKEHWSDWEASEKEPEEIEGKKADPLKGTIEKSVQGPEEERVYVGYRFPANDSTERYVQLISEMLSNGQAGLFDLKLEKEQKVLASNSYSNFYKDYGELTFYGEPKADQSLEEVKDLMLAQLDSLQAGNFPAWMLKAAMRNYKKERIQRASSNYKAFAFVDAFITEKPWVEKVKHLEALSDIGKKELVDFARENLDSNRVVVYKRHGEDTSSISVPKPPISEIDINRSKRSDYRKKFMEDSVEPIDPVYVNYQERIGKLPLTSSVPLKHTRNKSNELFKLYYIVEKGKLHDPRLSLAMDYLEKLGTERYSPEEVSQEFYKLATDLAVRSRNDVSYVQVSGLPETFEESVQLLEHLIHNVEADTAVYQKMVDNILQQRRNNKKNKTYNLLALYRYGMYGPRSSFTHKLSEKELRNTDPQALIERLHSFLDHEHKLYYHGQRDPKEVKKILAEEHSVPDHLDSIPPKKEFESRDPSGDSVFMVDYDMVQSQIALVSRDQEQSKELMPYSRVYNEYYGGGLSSIVFQEIRESRGLAYSASASYSMPDTGKHHFSYAILSTQNDKTKDAIDAMKELLHEMPKAKEQFSTAKQNILKKIRTNRITGSSVFWNYRSIREKGFKKDPRKMVYREVKNMTIKDMKQFFQKHVKGSDYDLLIITDKEKLNPSELEEYGTSKEIDKETIFGY